VAVLPEHPFNANFLHRRLQKDSMAVRDAWWSIYLHHTWDTRGAVDRLVDWSYSVTPSMEIDSEALDLCATALAWMLTTSNRFLRDRATQALVNLLSGRLDAVLRLVERFKEVNDLYVLERIYAVAYATAMQCDDPPSVGTLAASVYSHVFADQAPPAHILLRDYARGVIERALYLGANIKVVADHLRPPYKSKWPKIPTEEEIRPLLPDWSSGSYDSGDPEWARNTIGSSVMAGDFGRYVIGTNSSAMNWLSISLTETPWRSVTNRISELEEEFSKEEKAAWDPYKAAELSVTQLSFTRRFAFDWIGKGNEDVAARPISQVDGTNELDTQLQEAEAERDNLFTRLQAVLSQEHANRLKVIKELKDAHGDRSPRFDLRWIQRYVIWRVFDLGWTAKRFGYFDRFSRGGYGREAKKAERIGKKYQWIAYHEILGLISDHFQYREEFREDSGARAFDGPWQEWIRNIDPSCTLKALKGGTAWEGHSHSWWAPAEYDQWEEPLDAQQWVKHCDDLPRLEDMLYVRHPSKSSAWINLQGYFVWKDSAPADQESTDVERREIWYLCNGYLIRSEDGDAFLKWAETVHFWGRWMPDPPEIYQMFLGEHSWSAASRYFQKSYDGWIQPDHGCPLKLKTAVIEYRREGSTFDCSVDEGYTLRLPGPDLMNGLSLQWRAPGATYVNSRGECVAFDPTAQDDGPTALLIDEQTLYDFLNREGLAVCWAVLGEKRVMGPGLTSHEYASVEISGAYLLTKNGPKGFLNCSIPDAQAQDPQSRLIRLTTIRTP
jgi:hypothetical protein